MNNVKELKIDISEDELLKLKNFYNTDDEKEAVKKAINDILIKQDYDQLLALKGNVTWEGNLDGMRENRV